MIFCMAKQRICLGSLGMTFSMVETETMNSMAPAGATCFLAGPAMTCYEGTFSVTLFPGTIFCMGMPGMIFYAVRPATMP